MKDPAFEQGASVTVPRPGSNRDVPDEFDEFGVRSRRSPRDRTFRPSCRVMVRLIGVANRAADSTSVSSTDLRSKAERLMTLSTSAVAVCCCSDSAQLVQQPCVLDGDDGLGGEMSALARSACR